MSLIPRWLNALQGRITTSNPFFIWLGKVTDPVLDAFERVWNKLMRLLHIKATLDDDGDE